ncbi:MAG: 30S ribosomal protein S17 [Thermoplasmata archaeon]|nr:30S ribosomal protein S17 [Thermoplasmata archaeon]
MPATKKKVVRKQKARDLGVDVPEPERGCKDPNCPFHGTLSVRGQMIEGTVRSTGMDRSVVVEREYMHYLPKYERYEKRRSRYSAHAPECLGISAGRQVTIMECRPLSKTVSYVVVAVR